MADLLGENPNHIDDLFKKLGDWEEILKELPECYVDETNECE